MNYEYWPYFPNNYCWPTNYYPYLNPPVTIYPFVEPSNTTTIYWETGTIATGKPCCYCSLFHEGRICPRIKEIEYYETGLVKRVVLKESTNAN